LLPELLSSEEREWLNSYNTLVYDSLAPILPEAVKVWLKVKTKSI
jgi:Xaa-Pro aminopeptidase